jgi:hypothetical protein
VKEKKANRKIVKEVMGDPAFYNDQIDINRNPAKAIADDDDDDDWDENW